MSWYNNNDSKTRRSEVNCLHYWGICWLQFDDRPFLFGCHKDSGFANQWLYDFTSALWLHRRHQNNWLLVWIVASNFGWLRQLELKRELFTQSAEYLGELDTHRWSCDHSSWSLYRSVTKISRSNTLDCKVIRKYFILGITSK